MADVEITYKGSKIVEMSASGTKTLETAGKYCEDDLELKYTSPGGGGATLGEKSISANGVYNASSDSLDGYSKVTVAVPASAVDSGTKQITQNGNGQDVVGYAAVDVAVPNSYSAGDEGKVVSSGALVSQTSDTVTTNDTYDTTLINSLTVNVSGGGGLTNDQFVNHAYPQGAFTTTATDIPTQTFRDRTGITSFSAPDCTSLEGYSFYHCTALESVNIPAVTTFGASNVFDGCTSLEGVVLPVGFSGNSNAVFANCSSLKYIDMNNPSDNLRGGNTFNNCSVLDTVVLRRTSSVVTITTTTFNNTPFASGGSGGTLYVPSDLIASYQAASNWSTILGYANNSIKSIESTHTDPTAPIDLTLYYADGTLIPT